jgi:hypothetical protein
MHTSHLAKLISLSSSKGIQDRLQKDQALLDGRRESDVGLQLIFQDRFPNIDVDEEARAADAKADGLHEPRLAPTTLGKKRRTIKTVKVQAESTFSPKKQKSELDLVRHPRERSENLLED